MNTDLIRSDNPVALQHALDVLSNGGLIAFPTDTVYGLASLPSKTEYIERLYIAKGRESTRAIAILLSSADELENISYMPSDAALKLADKFWPGPITLIVPRHPEQRHARHARTRLEFPGEANRRDRLVDRVQWARQ